MVKDTVPILVVAGETSGEQHAACLVEEVNRHNDNLQLRWFGSGGQRMATAGVELLQDVSQLGAIGPWDALANLSHYWKLYREILAQTRRRRPRLAVLVDFPDFNLNLARRLKALGIPVCYFIGPQVWAWRSSRLKLIRRCVDLMLVILPFEEKLYRTHGVRAHYVGNPSVALKQSTITTTEGSPRLERKAATPMVALLPGSRRKEVERIFPLQLDAARYVADRCPVRFRVAQAPAIAKDDLATRYENWIKQGNRTLPLKIQKDGAGQILAQAHCAIIKSGISTLQALIYQVPFAMVYRMSPASWYLTKPLVRTDTYCLANLIAGKRIVPEFVQAEASGANIGAFIVRLLRDEDEHKKVKSDLRMASKNLGSENAYLEGARYVTKLLRGKC